MLAYCRPRISYRTEAWIEFDDGRPNFVIEDFQEEHRAAWTQEASWRGGKLVVKTRKKVDYDGYEGEKKRWGSFSLYGGMQFNHVDQGSARDVLTEGMLRLEAAEYPIVFHCHDEAVAEVGHNYGSAKEFETIFATNPAWLPGCPLASKGWEGSRYGK